MAAINELVITRTFDAPLDLMWRVWTEAEHLSHWWGPAESNIAVAEFDFRSGGKFLYVMHGPDGSEMWGRFVFREIDRPKRIVFVNSFSNEKGEITRAPFWTEWPLEILNTLTFSEANGKTTLTLRGGPINASDEERAFFEDKMGMVEQGFGGTFKQLADYLATQMSGRF